jgi:predicted dehydrogenase
VTAPSTEAHPPLRLGVLGAGMIATFSYGVLPNLKHISEKVEVVAIADPAIDRAQEAARDFGIPHAFSTLEEMLASCELDAIANLTPIPVHGETCLTILQAGKHLVTEKPLATTMEDADRIVALAAELGLTVVCAPPQMLFPLYRAAKRAIDEGTIGRPAYAKVRCSSGGPGSSWWPNDPSWFYRKGSGPVFDMGVYGIHEITGLIGPAKRVSAFSGVTDPVRVVRGGPFAGTEMAVTADDNVVFMLDFGDSTFALVDATFNALASRAPKIEIFGRRGVISLSDRMFHSAAPPLEVFRADALPTMGGWTVPESWDVSIEQQRVDRLQRAVLVDHLVDCVWNGTPPILSAEHARHALEIMLAIEESAATGRVVDLQTTF